MKAIFSFFSFLFVVVVVVKGTETQESQYYWEGEPTKWEEKKLTQVGILTYLGINYWVAKWQMGVANRTTPNCQAKGLERFNGPFI